MTANELVKEHGWDYAKGIVIGVESNFLPKNELYFQLKRLVESYELVESKGGLSEAKEYLSKKHILAWDALDGQLSQAVKDVEACHA